jgi:ELWxxDGT repeat protein
MRSLRTLLMVVPVVAILVATPAMAAAGSGQGAAPRGGVASVIPLAPPPTDGPSSYPNYLVRHGKFVWFSAYDPTYFTSLWKTDGTEGGTTLVIPDDEASDLIWAGNKLFFYGYDSVTMENGLFVSDGTSAGTQFVTSAVSDLDSATAIGGRIFFINSNAAHGYEPWVSDGTPAGTHMIKDIYKGTGSSYPSGFIAEGSRVLFNATDPTHGGELWSSSRSGAHAKLVKDIDPGQQGSYPEDMVSYRHHVVFYTDDGRDGEEPWITNGTRHGTHLLKNIAAGATPSQNGDAFASFVIYHGLLYFSAGEPPTTASCGGPTAPGRAPSWRSTSGRAGAVVGRKT